MYRLYRPVIPGGAMAPPDFCRSVNPMYVSQTGGGGKLCPPHHYWHPGFSDVPNLQFSMNLGDRFEGEKNLGCQCGGQNMEKG